MSNIKLQIALDFPTAKQALNITKQVHKYVDIIEMGTPLIKCEGLKVISQFKKFKKPIVADLKTMDTGFFEAELAYKAGASYATVLGVSDDSTIKGAIEAAKKYKKIIMVDLIGVSNIVKRAQQVLKFGADYVCIHSGIDMQHMGKTPLGDLKKLVKKVSSKKIAIAGGIKLETVDEIAKNKPGIIIVGGGITSSKNPLKAAKELKARIK